MPTTQRGSYRVVGADLKESRFLVKKGATDSVDIDYASVLKEGPATAASTL